MLFKKTLILIITTLILLSACSMHDESQDENLVSMEMAEQLTNQETGLSTELHDNLNLVLGGGVNRGSNEGCIPPNNQHRRIIISTEEGELNGFVWDETDCVYRRNGSNLLVESLNHYGTIHTFEVVVKLFTNNDLSGDGYQLATGAVIGNDPNVKSMTYYRVVDSEIHNRWRNITQDVIAVTDISITGIHDDVEGVLVSGLRTADVVVNAGLRTGNWTITTSFTDIESTRKIEGDTRYYTYKGSADMIYDGTFTSPWKTSIIHAETTVTFNCYRTVTITVNGETIIVDITTGDLQ